MVSLTGRSLIASRRALKLLTLATVLTFWCAFVFFFVTTNMCSSCASSQVWRFSVFACAPTCLLAVLPFLGRRTAPNSLPNLLGVFSLLVAGMMSLVIGLLLPIYIFEIWAETYSIVYFSLISFPFTTGMILLISVTLSLVSFNLAVAFREPLKAPQYWSVRACWKRVIRNLVVFPGFVLLLRSYVARFTGYLSTPAQGYVVFAILMLALMLIPLFTLYSELEKRHWMVKVIAGGGAILSIVEIVPNYPELINMMTPAHPFTMIPLFSLLLVCIGSVVGELGVFIYHPIRLSRGGLLKYAVCLAFGIGLVYLTWSYTHAAITVLI